MNRLVRCLDALAQFGGIVVQHRGPVQVQPISLRNDTLLLYEGIRVRSLGWLALALVLGKLNPKTLPLRVSAGPGTVHSSVLRLSVGAAAQDKARSSLVCNREQPRTYMM
jgi:hypothetical protein